jgi:3-oxoacyl-[acyl-carrier protein] reductase
MASSAHDFDDARRATQPAAGGRSLAIVSGAAAGIGLATLRRFVACDWDCIAIDQDAEGLARAGAEGQGRVAIVLADLLANDTVVASHLASIREPYQNVTLVNNVGGSRHGNVGLAGLSWDAAIETLAFNLKPAMHLVTIALPLLRASGAGRIVNVSSVAARTGNLDVPGDYAAAKAALIALSRQVVAELASTRILINTVCPGIIGTERIERRWRARAAADNEAVLARIPLKRVGTAEEVAEVIHFLGSASNTYMTGAIVDVNGGLFAP